MSGTRRIIPTFCEQDERTLRRLRRAERGKNIVGEEDSEGEDQVMEGNSHNHAEGVANNNNPEGVANNNNPPQRRVLASYTLPNPRHCGSSILAPNVHANNFELKPQLITLVQNNCSYGGGPLEDPNQHLSIFLRICETVKTNGVHPDVYKLLLFPFSLRDKAFQWLETFPKESINTWDDLVNKFLSKFYPPQRIIRLKTEVQTFTKMDGESLYEAWKRYKTLIRKCPPEMFSEWDKLQNFYEGLTEKSQESLDYSAGGSLQLMNTAEEAQNLIDMVTNNQYFFAHQRQRQPVQKKGVLELEGVDTIFAQNKLMHQQIQQQMKMMAKRINGLQLASVSTTNQASIEWSQNEAGNVEQQQEQVQYMQNTSSSFQNDFHGDTYNSSWRNHPNLRWGDNQNQWQKNNNSNHFRNTHSQNHSSNNTNQYKKPQNTYQPHHHNPQTHQNSILALTSNPQNYHTTPTNNFQQPHSTPIIPPIDHHESRLSSLEAALQAIAQSTQSLIKVQERNEATMKSFERQVGQLAKQAERPTNVLPSDTVHNPREECKALQLRSGKVIGESSNKEATKLKEQDTASKQGEDKVSTPQKSKEDEEPQSKTPTQDNHSSNKGNVKPQQENKNEGVKAYVPKLPYPTKIHKGTKDQQFPRFLEIFKKLEINIPLAEALE